MKKQSRWSAQKVKMGMCAVCGSNQTRGVQYCWKHYILRLFSQFGLHRRGHWIHLKKREYMIAFLRGRYMNIFLNDDVPELHTAEQIWGLYGFMARIPSAKDNFTKLVAFLDRRAKRMRGTNGRPTDFENAVGVDQR